MYANICLVQHVKFLEKYKVKFAKDMISLTLRTLKRDVLLKKRKFTGRYLQGNVLCAMKIHNSASQEINLKDLLAVSYMYFLCYTAS